MVDKRRQYGSGSVYYRAERGRYEATLEAGWTARGTRRRLVVSGKTEAEVKRKLVDKRRALARGETGTAGSTTVKSWAATWLDMRQRELRPKTYADYASTVRKWIVPTIGPRRLSDLGPADVRTVTEAQRKAGRSSTTLLHTHVILTTMLRDALVEGHPVSPRVLSMKRPSKATNDRAAMTVAEAITLLKVAAALPDGSRWIAALLQGMRQGECLGLTWECVDLDRGLIDVSWQLQTLPYLDRAAGTFRVPDGYETRHLDRAWHLVRPKSKQGWRVIPIVPPMAATLAAWRDTSPVSPHDLVWPRLNGRPVDVKTDEDEWRGLQGAAEIGHPAGRYYLLHEARHTTVTLLLEAGVDPGVVTAIVGHSSIATSRGYQHVPQHQARAALERVAGRLELTDT